MTAFIVPAMMADRFRGPHCGSIFGATQVASALGSALGAWLAGRMFDATGSYAIAFGVAAGAAAVAAWSVWASRIPAGPPGLARLARAGGRALPHVAGRRDLRGAHARRRRDVF